jgi:superfamily II DNA/RNA helicase
MQLVTADAPAPLPADLPTSFAGLGLPEPLVTALTRSGIEIPSPIQALTMPDALAGRDVLGRAETGSGKTLAFGLPLLSLLAARGRSRPFHPHGLVVVPTRELAEQIKDVLLPLGRSIGLSVTAVYGGAGMARQISAMERGTDIVVATPGRLEDLILRGVCHLDEIAVTVLDEADFIADLGFLPAVVRLLDQTPAGSQRLLFSATLDRGVDKVVRQYLHNPARHEVAAPTSSVTTMEHVSFTVRPAEKVDVATELARRPGRTLVFVRTKFGAERLATKLEKSGISAGRIHGDRNQSQRQKALDAFAAGRVPVLVATDVAARGIHVDGVDVVLHYDPPADHKDFLHRSGRTARAGARGTVVSLLLPAEVKPNVALHRKLGTSAPSTQVAPWDAVVAEFVASGTEITVIEEEPVRERSARRDRPARDDRARRRPREDAGRDSRPRTAGPRTDSTRGPRTDAPRSGGPRTGTYAGARPASARSGGTRRWAAP